MRKLPLVEDWQPSPVDSRPSENAGLPLRFVAVLLDAVLVLFPVALVIGLLRATFGVSFSPTGLWRYALAAGGMGLAVWFLRGYGLAVEIATGALAYGGALLALGYTRSADHLAMRRLLAQ